VTLDVAASKRRTEPAGWLARPWVVGLDLSLRATGLAYADGSVETVKPDKRKGMSRVGYILDRVRGALDVAEQPPDLVVIEGYTYGTTNSAHILGELGGVVRFHLWQQRVTFLEVAPSKLKRYALGKGSGPGTDKTAMVVAARERLGAQVLSDDEADALWLRAFGLALLGHPPVELPQAHQAALTDVELPGAPP
jgi:Holliday junction resolvasome RuvABC endonuclease subunit